MALWGRLGYVLEGYYFRKSERTGVKNKEKNRNVRESDKTLTRSKIYLSDRGP